ncbi:MULTISPECIES: DUF2935 domain-containing protein [Paenibacillus]|uniref:DUF2935 domain-containing protein n=1 Tax=Paenibacillus TaxID=44249 RepID=UPI0022B85813|nr:DUF2935 domain-containing protein [Paenibacillus caseinilyticus]MCZ8523177.1 DUF2935 domain-containing protein [Paenibacillus caseinilyticus]
MNGGAELTAWEEHLFWLEILQDHAYFVRDGLSAEARDEVEAARWYIAAFEQRIGELLGLSPELGPSSPQMMAFASAVLPLAEGYYRFEGRLQSLRIDNELIVNLTPTYFNGTLNENQEYLRQLAALREGRLAEPLPLWSLLDLWLEDQLGHAVLLRNIVDPIELGVLAQTDAYIDKFQAFILQNHHIRGYLRFSPPGMPRQRLLASDVGQAAIAMNGFILGVIARYKAKQVMNRTTLRFLEHHLPETCYFVRKLSRYAPEIAEEARTCSIRRVMGP